MKPEIEKFKKIIDESNNIVFFGGAGVSTESGIPDFRSANGIYNMDLGREVSPEEMISHTFYVRHTKDFYDFYKDKLIYKDAQPNACHKALAELEKQGKVKAVVTQNIDGLHQLAGSKTVFELHGSVLRNYCERCHAFYGVDKVLESEGVPYCDKCGGRIKPDVVGCSALRRRTRRVCHKRSCKRYLKSRYAYCRRNYSDSISGSRPHKIFQGEESGADQHDGDIS